LKDDFRRANWAATISGELRTMPSTRIATGEWAEGQEPEIIAAVQAALLASLKVPDWDRDIVLDLYDDKRRIVPTGRSERYTRVEIQLFSGRSLEAKRVLYQFVVQNLAALGIPATEIKIVLLEVPAHNWGLRGGLPASEVELGFKTDV
jgi:phenylpyruvate tautomerase PptA (4-oxalocrotonate tautomerase family)